MCEQDSRKPRCISLCVSKNLLEHCGLQIKSSYTKKCIVSFLLFPFYRLLRSWGKVMFLHVSVILFTGGSRFLCRGGLRPTGGVVSVRGGLCHGDPSYGNERAVRILLECILVETLSYLFCQDLSVFHQRLVLAACYCPSLSMKIFVMMTLTGLIKTRLTLEYTVKNNFHYVFEL